MAFGKTFILTLVAFIGLNFVFAMIGAVLTESIDTFFTDLSDMSILAHVLGGPISLYPGGDVIGIYSTTPENASGLMGAIMADDMVLETVLMYIFYIVAPLLAAIIAGRVGESRGQCFGAWFLVAMIGMGIVLVLELIAGEFEIALGYLLKIITAGVVNALFYGCFALLLSRSEFY